MYDIVFIGGGAAGLFGAAMAQKQGLRAAILEKNERVGKKLLVTGNGRCNLGNMRVNVSAYNISFPESALKRFPPERVIAEFRELGLITRTEGELIYPYSMLASSVLDALRGGISGVDVFTETRADKILRTAEGFDVIARCKAVSGASVILSAGSRASGGTDSAALFAEHGHSIIEPRPSLTQIPCKAHDIKGLNGLRRRVRATLCTGSACMSESGEMLFKQSALSGIASFNLSALLARTKAKSGVVTIDFYPDIDKEALIEIIKDGAFKYSAHKNIIELILSRARSGIAEDIANSAKAFAVNVGSSADFNTAQAVSGGLNTEEFSPLTMESLKAKGLFAVGEALNVDGLCGGYNLYWAWISALTAVEAIIAKNRG